MWNLINFSPVVPFDCITRVHAHLGITFCLTSCKTGVNAKYSCAWPCENEKPPQSERRKNNTPAYPPKGKFYKRLWTERSSSHNITYFHKRIPTAKATELVGGEPPAESTADLPSLPSRGEERLTRYIPGSSATRVGAKHARKRKQALSVAAHLCRYAQLRAGVCWHSSAGHGSRFVPAPQTQLCRHKFAVQTRWETARWLQ